MAAKYDREFYRYSHDTGRRAADVVLPILFEATPIRSVVDVGCGVGAWLKTARKHGAEEILGIDGPWLEDEDRLLDDESFMVRNLEEKIGAASKFDLAISLEVAEHLSAERADSFVDDLCSLSDLVLFSAATPGQGGRHHINEQWQSYWAHRFQGQGYRAYDFVRGRIWSRDEIPVWYKQNIVVYCRAESEADATVRSIANAVVDLRRLDMVHPELFALAMKRRAKKRVWYRRLEKACRPALRNLAGIRRHPST